MRGFFDGPLYGPKATELGYAFVWRTPFATSASPAALVETEIAGATVANRTA